MFAVIYYFKVKKGREKAFVQSWRELTELIYKFNGSLGSRLHINQHGDYISFAQWPSELLWEDSSSKIIRGAEDARIAMKNSCEDIKVLYKLNMVEDYLQSEQFTE